MTSVPPETSRALGSKPSAFIDSLTFSDGTTLSFAKGDIVVFVGPNNSGKSAALRNIRAKFQQKNEVGVVVTDIGLKRDGDKQALIEWLESNFKTRVHSGTNHEYQGMGTSFQLGHLDGWWVNCTNGFGNLSHVFCCHLTADERLNAAKAASNISYETPASHPLHYLYRKDTLEKRLSKLFKRAFDQSLILNRYAGSTIPLHVGEKPAVPPGQQEYCEEYATELQKLPPIETQGDGMRSFTGVLLHSIIMDHSVLLVDEPEAFLHPPQARHLGKMIATEAKSERQFFIATHSGDFLRGLLDSGQKNIRVIRLERKEKINPVKELKNEEIRDLWSDSLLRYSNVLDGMFHEMVILCESDSDCRFFAAVLDAIYDAKPDEKRPDIMFTHCGGKDRLKVGAKALKGIGVKVAIIADLDALNEKTLEFLCEALSGNWSSVSHDWQAVKNAIENKKAEISSEGVKKKIDEILKNISTPLLPSSVAKDIKDVLKQSSPWSLLKNCGKAFIPSGGPTQAFDRLDAALNAIGIFLVPCGETEGFDKSVSEHGPAWVNEVLKRDFRTDPLIEPAKAFLKKLLP